MREMSKWEKATLALLVWAFLLIVVTPAIMHTVARRGLNPTDAEQLDRYLSDVCTLPPGWLHAPPYAAETTACAVQLVDGILAVPPRERESASKVFRELATGDTPDDALASATVVVAQVGAIVATTTRLVRCPDYDLQLLEYWPDAAFGAVRCVVIAAHVSAAAGQETATLDHLLTAVLLAAHHEPATRSTEFFAGTLSGVAFRSLSLLLPSVSDAQSLRSFAAALADVEPRLNWRSRSGLPPALVDAVGCLRDIRRHGAAADLPPTGTAADYAERAVIARARFLDGLIAQAPAGSSRQAELTREALSGKYDITLAERSSRIPPPLRVVTRAQLARISLYPYAEQETFRNSAAARYSLARVAVAARIMELEEGRRADRVADLVPKYLPTEPLDPFTSQPFLVKRPPGDFYSAGPNGTDDGADPEKDVTLDSPYRAAPTPATNTAPAAAAP